MTSSVCVTSVGYGERYTPYLDRLETSLKRHNPNFSRLFYRDCWPPKSPSHQEMHYAFKAHAMDSVYWAAFDIGIWLDSACEVLGDITPIVQEIQDRGYYIAADEQPLGEWISDAGLSEFGVGRDEAMKLGLCGGAIVGINFRKPEVLGWPFLSQWLKLSSSGLFYSYHSEFAPDKMTSLKVTDGPIKTVISHDPRVKGHRSDEACFSLMLHQRKLQPMDIAKHFTHAGRPNQNALIKTGYDISQEGSKK